MIKSRSKKRKRGGGCNACGLWKTGGCITNTNKGIVGQPTYPSKIQTWPGVDGISGNRNYYAFNSFRHVGGRRRRRKTKKNRGWWNKQFYWSRYC